MITKLLIALPIVVAALAVVVARQPKDFFAKAVGLVPSTEAMIGGNFEKGLADLKSLAEATASRKEAE